MIYVKDDCAVYLPTTASHPLLPEQSDLGKQMKQWVIGLNDLLTAVYVSVKSSLFVHTTTPPEGLEYKPSENTK